MTDRVAKARIPIPMEHGPMLLYLITITIMLLDYHATVRLNTNQIMLRSSIICEFASTHCVDTEGGNTY